MRTLTLIVAAGLVAGCGKRETGAKGETVGELSTNQTGIQRQASTKPKQEEEPTNPITVPALTLWQEYHDNAIAADKKYKGKWVRIDGGVSAVKKSDKRNEYYVGYKHYHSFGSQPILPAIATYIDKKHESDFTNVREDQPLTVLAKVVGVQHEPLAYEGIIVVVESARFPLR